MLRLLSIAVVVCSFVAVQVLGGEKNTAPHPISWFTHTNVFNVLHPVDSRAAQLEPQWFDQLVDHFDPSNKDTWKQLYYVNDQWFDGEGPVILYFNGEGPLSPSAITSDTFVTELAQRYHALLVSQEHRYYGQSFPVPDLSTPNMRFLTVEQALEDAAYFEHWFTETKGLTNNEWVVMGGSYSGFLSTAYRIRYPHLVTAAYSSSGVVLPIVDYTQYFDVVGQDFSWYPDCYKAIQNVSASITDIWEQGDSGLQTLTNMFGLCDSLTEDDETDFWSTISGPSAGAAQYGYTKDVCAVVLGAPTPLQGWAFFFKQSGSKFAGIDWSSSCVDIDWKKTESNTTIYTPYHGARTWIYQTCIEFGWFQTTTTSKLWPPVIDLSYFLDGCSVMFKPGMEPNIDQILTDYGGLEPEGSRIVSCAGLADPWHPACQLSTYKQTEPVIFIDAHDASHCKDMSAPSDKDSDELKNARKEVQHWLDTWLDY